MKKKTISLLLVLSIMVGMMSATVTPAYAASTGTHWQNANSLLENQTATFTLPREFPSVYTVSEGNRKTTYYDYKHSRWFKIYVPSDNTSIKWTISGVSSQSFTDTVCVEVSDQQTVEACGGCVSYWCLYSPASQTQKLPTAGVYYIHIFGEDLTTELEFQYSLTTPVSAISNMVPEASPLDSASEWAREDIVSAIGKGLVATDIQNDYRNVITRAEFCRMAVKLIEHVTNRTIDELLTDTGIVRNMNLFIDTNDPDILAAYALGITFGTSNNYFLPDSPLSREQAAVLTANLCKTFGFPMLNQEVPLFVDLDTASVWAIDGIEYCRINRIMSGTGGFRFNPKGVFTIEQSILTFNYISSVMLPWLQDESDSSQAASEASDNANTATSPQSSPESAFPVSISSDPVSSEPKAPESIQPPSTQAVNFKNMYACWNPSFQRISGRDSMFGLVFNYKDSPRIKESGVMCWDSYGNEIQYTDGAKSGITFACGGVDFEANFLKNSDMFFCIYYIGTDGSKHGNLIPGQTYNWIGYVISVENQRYETPVQQFVFSKP